MRSVIFSRPATEAPNKPLVAIFVALLAIAALVLWRNGELDANASVVLLAFVALGVAALLPRVYDFLFMGVFTALAFPIQGLLTGRLPGIDRLFQSQPDVFLAQDEFAFWQRFVEMSVLSLAMIVFGVVRLRRYYVAQRGVVPTDGM